VRINIGGSDGNLVANKDISQHVELHENTVTKLESLSALLTNMDESVGPRSGCHSVVFVARKRDADMVAADIRDSFRNVRAAALHGDLSQARRDQVLHNVKSGRVQVLVATDVAARGLDVRSIQQVINFDMPTNMEDYIHRIGRTGRAGAKGEAHTFVHPKMDASHVLKLCKVMSDHEQPIPPELSALADSVRKSRLPPPKRGRSGGNRGGGNRGGYGGRSGYGGGGGGGYGGGNRSFGQGRGGGFGSGGGRGARRYDDGLDWRGGDGDYGDGRRGSGGGRRDDEFGGERRRPPHRRRQVDDDDFQ